MEERAGIKESGTTSEADVEQSRRSWFWMVRRLFGLIAPILVLALVGLIRLMFDTVAPDDTAAIDYTIMYTLALLSPMGLTALAGYLCAYSTRGNPAPVIGKVSLIINLLFTVVLIIPAMIMLSFFLRIAPTMIPELIAWLGT